MNRLTAYLLRALLVAMVFVTFAVTAAVWLTQSLRYVDIVVENGAPVHLFIWLAMLTLPTFLGVTLPIALFVAVIFTYHRFIQDSELVAMRACGMGPVLLAKPALLLGAGTMLFCYLISLWIQPLANRELVKLQYYVQSQFSAALLKEGVFNDLGNKMTIYVARRENNSELSGLLIQDNRNAKRLITIRAERGQLMQSSDGPQVVVYNGIQQEYDASRQTVSELSFDSYAVSLATLIPTVAGRSASPREVSTLDLFRSAHNEPEKLRRGRLISELHQRFAMPPMSLGFVLIATCALLFGEFNRRGNTRKVVFAVGVATAFQGTVVAVAQLISKNTEMAPMLYVSTLLPIAAGGYLLWQSEREAALA